MTDGQTEGITISPTLFLKSVGIKIPIIKSLTPAPPCPGTPPGDILVMVLNVSHHKEHDYGIGVGI